MRLGVWEGTYSGTHTRWLRWFRRDGTLVPAPQELAETAETRAAAAEARLNRAEEERQRADEARQRAAALEAELKALRRGE